MKDRDIVRQGLEEWRREFGPDGLARFLRLHRAGTGDYTRDRVRWQKDLTLDQVLASIRDHRPH